MPAKCYLSTINNNQPQRGSSPTGTQTAIISVSSSPLADIDCTFTMKQESDFDKDLWNAYVLQQEELCNKLGLAHAPVDPYQILGLSADINLIPMNGLRHPGEQNTTGWYIWSGEYSVANDFFQPVHVYHLLSTKPNIIKYLGLPIGYRFLIDDEGYEDIWYDETLLNI